MELAFSLASILGILLIGAISPGPSFVLVARTAMAVSRRDALGAAIGMGAGGVVFAALALLGLQALLAGVPALYLALKVAGGLYLMHLALRIWRGARAPLVIAEANAARPVSLRKSFLLGLFTQLSNPKTALVYGSVFAALLPAQVPLAAVAALPLLVFLVEAGWYCIVAVALSAPAPRAAYLRSKTWVDRIASGVIGLLGLKLAAGAAGPA